jgi:hypothetical protein
VIALPITSVARAGAPDRLDRFRALAASRLAVAQLGEEVSASTYAEIYQLLDDEIVDSLASGGPFASVEFLTERLDAFTEAWGSTVVRVTRVGQVLVGAFQLGDGGSGNSVRVYGRLGGSAAHDVALLGTLSRDGRPTVHPLPATDPAIPQFLVVWEGAPTGRGSRALRIDHVRQHGDDPRVVWSTAALFPEGLMARGYSARGSEIRIRYEVRYPGWTPGCDGQTEHEDVYRLAMPAATFTRAVHRELNGWHRDFRVSVSQLFAALTGGDGRALGGLVPDAGLRRTLPRTLRAEPACDAADGLNPDKVSVAASVDESPWQLTFHRAGTRWRLVGAEPVIQ